MHGPWPKAQHPAELSPDERAEVLAVLNRQDYANLSPTQVYVRELDEGRYWCSQRTMYRVLSDAKMGGERRRLATHPPKAIPELMATKPCDVWSCYADVVIMPTSVCDPRFQAVDGTKRSA